MLLDEPINGLDPEGAQLFDDNNSKYNVTDLETKIH